MTVHEEAVENDFIKIKGTLDELLFNRSELAKDKGYVTPVGITLDEYQNFVQSCIAYPDTMRLIYPALELCNEAGEVAGKIKKVIRGDATLAERREAILDEMGDVMFPLSALLTELGSTFEEIIALNMAKLKRRQAAGTIKGDGDKR